MESVQSLRAMCMDGALSQVARAYGGFVVIGLPDMPVGVILTGSDDADLIPCLWQAGIVVYESHIWDGSSWISVVF